MLESTGIIFLVAGLCGVIFGAVWDFATTQTRDFRGRMKCSSFSVTMSRIAGGCFTLGVLLLLVEWVLP